MLRPTPVASRFAALASTWFVAAVATRVGAGKTDDFRPAGSRWRASRSARRGAVSGSPIGMSIADDGEVGVVGPHRRDEVGDGRRDHGGRRTAAQHDPDPAGLAAVHAEHRAGAVATDVLDEVRQAGEHLVDRGVDQQQGLAEGAQHPTHHGIDVARSAHRAIEHVAGRPRPPITANAELSQADSA